MIKYVTLLHGIHINFHFKIFRRSFLLIKGVDIVIEISPSGFSISTQLIQQFELISLELMTEVRVR